MILKVTKFKRKLMDHILSQDKLTDCSNPINFWHVRICSIIRELITISFGLMKAKQLQCPTLNKLKKLWKIFAMEAIIKCMVFVSSIRTAVLQVSNFTRATRHPWRIIATFLEEIMANWPNMQITFKEANFTEWLILHHIWNCHGNVIKLLINLDKLNFY